MRNILPKILYKKIKKDKNIIVLLGDIGVFGFKKVFGNSKNIYNLSTLEQSMMGFASGLAINKKKVYVYSITPFVVERCFEQIKVDLCYQKLNVNIISCGGSLEYSELGPLVLNWGRSSTSQIKSAFWALLIARIKKPEWWCGGPPAVMICQRVISLRHPCSKSMT